MIARAWTGGLLAVSAVMLPVCAASAEDARQPSPPPVILTLPGRPIESSDKALSEAIKDSVRAPKPSGAEDWVLQPDGSMRNTRTGLSMMIRNVCAPGDLDHEAALLAFKQAQANKTRRR